MPIGEIVKWIIIEVADEPAGPQFFISPATVKLEPGFIGELVWYVFTPGWELDPANGIHFTGSEFVGDPQPDPNRTSCWSTATANECEGTFQYAITLRRCSDGQLFPNEDPAVENEPPSLKHQTELRLSAAS